MNKIKISKIREWFLSAWPNAKSRIHKPLLSVKKYFSEKWNLYLAEPSFKRIYRNSEGFIFPFFGGVVISLLFQSIYLWRADKNTILVCILLFFIAFLGAVILIVYQIKKANLRDNAIKELETMFIKHCNPYDYIKDPDELKNIKKKNFYYSFYFYTNLNETLDRYIENKYLYHSFNPLEIALIRKEVITNLIRHVEEKLNSLPIEIQNNLDKLEIFPIRLAKAFNNSLMTFNALIILKIGNDKHPHNSRFAKIDIKNRDSSFTIFESLNNKKENNFCDINSQHVTHAEYKKDTVILTIAQPNATPYKITVSLSEWLANRNDLC